MQRSRAFVARLGTCVLLVVPATLLGCGRPAGTVSGKVTKNGVPLPGGSITYQSADGKVRLSSPIDPEDGTYSIPNVPLGEGKFGVDNTALQGQAMPPMMPGGVDPLKAAKEHAPSDLPSPGGAKGRYVAIDPKYKDPNTSGFTWTVKKGSNRGVDWEVK
jgi:hypothetical protein